MSKDGRKRYHHGDLRAELVEQARSLVEERGVEALSLREVARRADVSRAAPYHHFENKEAMVAAVAQDGFARLAAAMEAIAPSDDPLVELECCGRGYIRFALANPTLYRLMFGTKVGRMAEHPALEASAKCAFELLLQRLARVLPADADPKPCGMAVWAAVHGMASLLIDDAGPYDTTDPASVERWTDAVMELIGRGLGR